MYELPDIKSELERKSLDTLENLVLRRESGAITNAEYQCGIDTLFSICSGLVDGGFFELISDAAKETVRDYSFARTRVFRRDKKLAVLIRTKSKGAFQFSGFVSNITIERVSDGYLDETDTNAETEVKIAAFEKNLAKQGYVEIK